MTRAVRTVSPRTARRLAISRQRLAGPRPAGDPDGIVDLVRDLGCLQLDPIGVIAKSHRLVLWSRVGAYDPGVLDRLLWQDRRLFEYWAHAASIVLTENYQIHYSVMRRVWTNDSARARYVRRWIEDNARLRQHILTRLRREGPLRSRDFQDRSTTRWVSGGWTTDRSVSQMLSILWTQGRIMVAGRVGAERVWELTERWLPESADVRLLPRAEVVRRAAERSLRCLGVATRAHIGRHFVRGEYPGLREVLERLERVGNIQRVEIAGSPPGRWFLHAEDGPLLERLERGEWEPRTTLLSPFDNLICDRERTELLFGFEYRSEIYTPKDKRRFGFYAMPILRGDRLIGRVDAKLGRDRDVLVVNAVHGEPDVAPRAVDRSAGEALRDLGRFLGVRGLEYPNPA